MRLTEENTGTDSRSALRGMVSFFTLWHLDITQRDMDSMEERFHMVPLVGMIFGIIITIEVALLSLLAKNLGMGSGLLNAVTILLTVYVGSKFIHFDGLTDFGDGMIVSGQKEDHVRALKDTLVGAGGIGVALLVTLTSVAMYSLGGYVALMLVAPLTEILVKNAMVFAAAYGEPGNGMAGRQVSMTMMSSGVRSVVICIICCVVLSVIAAAFNSLIWDTYFTDTLFTGVLITVIGLVVSIVVGNVMATTANRNFGMVNGDILGATNEISRPALMFLMLLAFALIW